MKNQTRHRPTSHLRAALLGALTLATACAAHAGSPPVITDVTAYQQAGTKKVEITYKISDRDSTSVNVSIFVSKDSGATWTVPAMSFTGTGAPGVNIPVTTTATSKSVEWDAGADWDGQFTTHCRVRVMASDNGMVGIPAGSYMRGTPPALNDADITDAPKFPVTVSAFMMDSTPVTGGLWSSVKAYADLNSYQINTGSFQGAQHPVQTINWFDAVKWCNARSEMEGLSPVYYLHYDAAGFNYSDVYKTGQVAPFMNFYANGYRLPTEAEWEKAARGGLAGHRFPWTGVLDAGYSFQPDRIGVSDRLNSNYEQANFNSTSDPHGYAKLIFVGVGGYNQYWSTPPLTTPFTNVTGFFPPNGYQLSDMAGNVFSWCWDWYGPNYYAAGQTDPQGPTSGTARVARGGSWNDNADFLRCANRASQPPTFVSSTVGFRCVRTPPSSP